MSKCNFECECPGVGKCCLECDLITVCESVCQILDIDKPRIELEKVMENCDWYEKYCVK